VNRLSLRAGPRSGLEIAEARDWRIDVAPGGGVVLHRPGTSVTVVAAPGQVARIVVLQGGQVPRRLKYFKGFDEVLALLSDDAALLVVPLHLMSHGKVTNAAELRRASGADDFAQALGLTLAPATEREAHLASSAGSVTTVGPVRSVLRHVVWRHGVLIAIATIGLIAAINLTGDASLIAGLAGAVATALLAVDQWRYRARFLELVENPPDSRERVDVPNVLGPERENGAREARLQIGPDDIVHVLRGTEVWIPGPRRGGAARCLIGRDSIRFLDHHGTELLIVDAASWIPADDDTAVQQACRQAGVDCDTAGDSYSTGFSVTPVMSEKALGDFIVMGPFATSLVAFVLMMGHLFPLEDLDLPRAVVAVLAGAAAAVSTAAQLRQRRWERRQRRVEAHPAGLTTTGTRI
jgi:hypothetical protein